MVLLVFFFPFFVTSAHYFEALERTGTVGAIVADTFFQPAIVGYIAILWILKKRKIYRLFGPSLNQPSLPGTDA